MSNYSALVALGSQLRAPAPTRALSERTGIALSDKGLIGALNMLEVEGVLHQTASRANQRCWLSGAAKNRSARRDDQLKPYVKLRETLRRFSGSAIDAHFLGRAASFEAKDHERVLGALKALAALNLIVPEHRGARAIWWRWVAPGGEFQEFDFGEDVRPKTVSYVDGLTDLELARQELRLPRKRRTSEVDDDMRAA